MTSDSTHFILATAGHVDHGKSALVKALTGTDPDRLPEEKARGITIDLGFAHLTLRGPGPVPREFHLGIVDVPGHEDFVANMVAGVGSIDVALLVVAADDGWMPQTEEHLQILAYLGVTRAVVALTKIDLAGPDELPIVDVIREQLRGTPFADAAVVPTSATSSRGLDALKSALSHVLAEMPPPRDIGKPRLAVDRAFALRGIGTIVTGTLTGGSFQRGQPVIIQPLGQATRIRTIQSHNQDLVSIGPGQRGALNLTDIGVARRVPGPGDSETGVRRGQIVTMQAFGQPARELDVLLQRSSRPISFRAGGPQLLKDGARVRLHHGTANVPGRLVLANAKMVAAGDTVTAELRLDSPVFAFAGDHFILRDWAEQTTLAGGIVLDPQPNKRRFRTRSQRGFLLRQSESLKEPANALGAWLERDRMAHRGDVLVRTHFSPEEIAGAIARLEATGSLVVMAALVADATFWKALRDQAIELINAHHRAHPEQPGLPLSQLRSALAAGLAFPEAFDALLLELANSGFDRMGTTIKRGSHGPALPPHLAAAAEQIRHALSVKPLDPPSRKELVTSLPARQALVFLLASGQAVEIGPEVVLLAGPYKQAVELVRKRLANGGAATVSELRQVLGSTRRVVVPLLERFDREGITRRQGDLRVLGAKAGPH